MQIASNRFPYRAPFGYNGAATHVRRVNLRGDPPMLRLAPLALLIVALPAQAQGPNPAPDEGVATMIRLLDQSIDTSGISVDKVKLKQALEYFNDKMGGRLPILVDRSAFVDATDP